MKYLYDIYSPMLEGFIAMDFETRIDALIYIMQWEDKIEAKQFRIIAKKI